MLNRTLTNTCYCFLSPAAQCVRGCGTTWPAGRRPISVRLWWSIVQSSSMTSWTQRMVSETKRLTVFWTYLYNKKISIQFNLSHCNSSIFVTFRNGEGESQLYGGRLVWTFPSLRRSLLLLQQHYQTCTASITSSKVSHIYHRHACC